jgi:predicted permease
MHIINTLSPVFLLIALGAVLRKTNFFNDDFVAGLTRLVYWIALPCMLFYKIAAASYDFQVAGKTFLVFLCGILVAGLVAWGVAMVLRLKSSDSGTFVQSSLHGNLVFVGLAVILYDIANSNPPNGQYLQTLAVVVVAFGAIANNFLAVTVLKIAQHNFGIRSLWPIAKGVLTNPLIIASLAGIAYSFGFDHLPRPVYVTFETVGRLALPAALISIGATLVQVRIVDNLPRDLACSVIKIFVAPIAGYFVAGPLGVSGSEMKIALILLASPTAVAAYILASRLDGNTRLSAAVVVLTTILSIASLATVLALF